VRQTGSKAQIANFFISEMISRQYKIKPNRPKVKELSKNSLKEIRESFMIAKVELARKTDLSPKTITRIEQGLPCKMETKLKIIRKLRSIIADENEVMASFIRDNGGVRLGLDRRQFSYDKHIPERRSGKDRRNGLDRRLRLSKIIDGKT
jgi:DNA-binding XRE family transcriptional regulator